jgi:hypothetical protein
MSKRKKKLSLFAMAVLPVIAIIVGAFALSGEAVQENLHYVNAANQVLDLVSTVRTIAAGQKGFAQNPGEDIWADLEHVGQIATGAAHLNPWHGDVRAVAVAGQAMRIESDMPTRDCRRLALYFLGRQPTELGLLSIEAESTKQSGWVHIFPSNMDPRKADTSTGLACGSEQVARLALIFRIR